MRFSLIICTYHRPEALKILLESVKRQTVLPHQILIIDGSRDYHTKSIIERGFIGNMKYYKVEEENRGLTRQRNFGVEKLNEDIEVVFFLDDDTILFPDYFEQILKTYREFPYALGVSGYIVNEQNWTEIRKNTMKSNKDFIFDGWTRKEGSRFILRKKFGLSPNVPPGFMPDFSHGYSSGFLPPSGKPYEVEMLMGGIASYKKEVFEKLNFSSYFEGYGLYEDADFSLRVSKMGKLYVNTGAKVEHHHAVAGRPNKFIYGKMVVRNGWYVWRLKNPRPSLLAKIKWNATSFLLTLVRFSNVFNTKERVEAFTEAVGRTMGWFSLMFNKPKV
ncbi:glycosyltransferase family 2 protein [Antarcticibacterium arcticum]|uniref:Glycosyltransferase family 2 protein n=1 Tax=Antarcticibacterium arcticum TaxID=2585771 RepID=A0A5B8YJ38_9FLAO|nr:glycosyltransferase family A protein [Antarcticibacterium arcticum]QED37745.1 glycosyltransferase family 2 protein [Antarcticibacterium arcticum]